MTNGNDDMRDETAIDSTCCLKIIDAGRLLHACLAAAAAAALQSPPPQKMDDVK